MSLTDMSEASENAPLNDEDLKNLEEMISKMSQEYTDYTPQQQYGIQEVVPEQTNPTVPAKGKRGKKAMTPARLAQLAKARSVFLENVKKRKDAEELQFQEYKKSKREEDVQREYMLMKKAEESVRIESEREEKKIRPTEVEPIEYESSYFSGFFTNVLKMAAIGGAVLVLKAYAPEQIVEQKQPNKN